MGRYERIRREKREQVGLLVASLAVGLGVGIGVGVMVGVEQGRVEGVERANSVISEYMASEYGADMLTRCEQDGLKGCRIEFDYTDGVITGIEVVGRAWE